MIPGITTIPSAGQRAGNEAAIRSVRRAWAATHLHEAAKTGRQHAATSQGLQSVPSPPLSPVGYLHKRGFSECPRAPGRRHARHRTENGILSDAKADNASAARPILRVPIRGSAMEL